MHVRLEAASFSTRWNGDASTVEWSGCPCGEVCRAAQSSRACHERFKWLRVPWNRVGGQGELQVVRFCSVVFVFLCGWTHRQSYGTGEAQLCPLAGLRFRLLLHFCVCLWRFQRRGPWVWAPSSSVPTRLPCSCFCSGRRNQKEGSV